MNQQNKTERWEEEFKTTRFGFDIDGKECVKFIRQLLSDARREERERCLEALPKKKAIENIEVLELKDGGYTDFSWKDRGFNQALTTAEESIKNLPTKQ